MTTAFEQHYRVKELAEMWGFSAETITRLLRDEPGVLRLDNIGNGKRNYAVLSIPESVVQRVHDRLSARSLPKQTEGASAPRVIRLRELGLTAKSRRVVRLKAGEKGI